MHEGRAQEAGADRHEGPVGLAPAAARSPPFALWIALPALALLLGPALQMQQRALAPAWVPLATALGCALLLATGACVRAAGPRPWHRLAPCLAGLACLALAWAATEWRAGQRVAERLAPALEGVDLELTGRIAQLPQPGLLGTRFVFEVESARQEGTPVVVPPRLALSWARGAEPDALLLGPAEALRAGQRWRLPVRLRQPHGAANPHGFDLELYLFERRIGAVGSVRARAAVPALKLDENAGAPVERLRQTMREAIEARVADPSAAGVLAALAIGDQGAIERADWDLFRQTGVAHLMSISGLHVTMFAWLAGGVVAWFWRRSDRLARWWPAPHAGRWGGLVAAAAYALLAGWGVPAQRTVGMIAIVVLLASSGVRWPLHLVLLVAGAAVVAADPWALMQPGFWLSFVAVALLVAADAPAPAAAEGWRARTAQAVRSALRTQAVATVGLAPLTLVFFRQISLVGFGANLLAIPVVTLLVTPLALLGMLLPPLWQLGAWVVQGLNGVLALLAALPGATWTAAAAAPWAAACGLLGGALAVLPLPWRLRLLALPLMLPLLAPPVPRPAAGSFELVAADIGQGTAVLVRTERHLLLYDTGPAWTAESDAGARLLVPLLQARGERRIDLLMLSHRDADHVGGAASIMKALPVRALSTSLEPGHPLLAAGVPHRRCEAGQRWQWDGVDFEILHPSAEEHAQARKPNAASCVLRVAAGGRSALLTGDIEAAQEAALVARSADALVARGAGALDVDVLLVPHHGSRTSSTPAFIDATSPRVAVVQAAYRSRFGHPAPDVVRRYAERGIELVRTDRCGAWSWVAGAMANNTPPRCERQTMRRYWHHPGAP